MAEFIFSGPDDAAWTLMLGHGAGAGMDTPFMSQMAALLAERSVGVVRFEFGYMASRRVTGKRKPPPKAEALVGEYRAAIAAVAGSMIKERGRLAIGGKSMGGRVASLIADELFAAGTVDALVCLGYPFHPPGMPEKTRTAHLADIKCPTLVVQGERDPFGNATEVGQYALPNSIRVQWLGDGDHDFGPRGASGYTRKGNLAAAADAVSGFLEGLPRR